MPAMRAKMRVESVHKTEYAETLKLSAVGRSDSYPDDGTDENNTYSLFTPAGECELFISNPALHGKFIQGEEYYIDFTPVVNAG